MAFKIKRSIITIEVLSDINDNPHGMDIANVIEEATNGGFSMKVIEGKVDVLENEEAIKACNDQGTDPYFFQVESANYVEDEEETED